MITQRNMNSFEEIYDNMKLHKMKLPANVTTIKVPQAKQVLQNALTFFLSKRNEELKWLPEYDNVAKWLENNNGRGIFMFGNCGRGKSLLGRYVIPAILLKYCGKVTSVFDIQEMNKNIDLVMSKQIISLDDIGTEEMINNFGNKRLAFAEIMDAAEKQGKLMIISTNLTQNEIVEQYGDRILDRIKSTTERILFNGESLRS